MSIIEAENSLRQIAEEVQNCKRCPLSYSRKNSVPGEGPANSEILFIGEGPGFYENEQGRPFVGQAGKYLEELLHKIGLNRTEVYITNVVKCRPPANRDPQDEELNACRDFLERQIQVIQPRIIVTLGRFSMARYFKDAKISLVHGNAIWVKGQMIIPMYHPAAGLHQPTLKASIEKDFLKVPDYIQKARNTPTTITYGDDTNPPPEGKDQDKPTQMNLF